MSFDLIDTENVIKLIKSVNEMKAQLQQENEDKLLSQWVDGPFVLKKLKICSRTLYALRKNGKLKFSQFGRKILYKNSDLEDFIQQNYK
jgi:hypothetical protein